MVRNLRFTLHDSESVGKYVTQSLVYTVTKVLQKEFVLQNDGNQHENRLWKDAYTGCGVVWML